MPTFCQIEQALLNAAADIVKSRQRYDQAGQTMTAADNVLAGLAATYGQVIAEIEAQAAANPDDPAWAMLQNRMAKYIAERNDLKAATACMVDAFQAILDHGAAAVQAKIDEL